MHQRSGYYGESDVFSIRRLDPTLSPEKNPQTGRETENVRESLSGRNGIFKKMGGYWMKAEKGLLRQKPGGFEVERKSFDRHLLSKVKGQVGRLRP